MIILELNSFLSKFNAIQFKPLNQVSQLIEYSFENFKFKQNEQIKMDSVSYLVNKIENGFNKFASDHSKFYGPFTVLCNSSGMGKSRIFNELCKYSNSKNIYVVYHSLKSYNGTGYPSPSYFASYFTRPFKNTQHAKLFYTKFLNKYIDILNNPNSYSHMDENLKDKIKNNAISPQDYFECFSKNQKIVEKIATEIWFDSESSTKFKQIKVKDAFLVFVFDEASSLLTNHSIDSRGLKEKNYFILRSILSDQAKELIKQSNQNKIFSLFLDTLIPFNELAPITQNDPSLRVSFENEFTIEPIFLIPTWNIFKDVSQIRNIKESVQFGNVCMFGRPLWYAWYKSNIESEFNFDEGKLIALAEDKLIGGQSKLKKKLNYFDVIAIFSVRIGILKPVSTIDSQNLVAKNMAVCLNIDKQKSLFEINYPSEPILAEAAARLMNSNVHDVYLESGEKFTFDTMIRKLNNLLAQSIVHKGNLGQKIALIILIKAMDLSKHEYLNHPFKFLKIVTVKEFLLSLYGQDAIVIIKQQLNDDQLLNGYVNFNHFVHTENEASEINYTELIKHCAALHCRQTQTEIDMVIPVCLDENNFDNISAIFIQVKLHKKSVIKRPKFEFDKIDLSFLNNNNSSLPFLVIYMQLGLKNNVCLTNPTVNFNIKAQPNAALIYSEGIIKDDQLVFKCLNQKDANALVDLTNVKVEPSNLNETDKKIYNYIKSTF